MVEVGAVEIDGPLLDHDARDQRDETRVDGLSKVEGDALVTRFPIIEPGNPDYQTRDMCAAPACRDIVVKIISSLLSPARHGIIANQRSKRYRCA